MEVRLNTTLFLLAGLLSLGTSTSAADMPAVGTPVAVPLVIRQRYEGESLRRLIAALEPFVAYELFPGKPYFWRDGRLLVTVLCNAKPGADMSAGCFNYSPSGGGNVIHIDAKLGAALPTVLEVDDTEFYGRPLRLKKAAIECTGDQTAKKLDSCVVLDLSGLKSTLCGLGVTLTGIKCPDRE